MRDRRSRLPGVGGRWRGTRPIAAVVLIGLLLTPVLAADMVSLVGSGIPLKDCRIQAIRSGQVFFLDGFGQRYQRPLEDIRGLSFEGLPDLDEAEKAIAAGDLDSAVRRLLRALLRAQTDLQRLWVHVRLSRIHDRRGEFVQAARHAAGVWVLTEDAYWRVLEPLSDPPPADGVSYAAVFESMTVLREARRRVRPQGLGAVIERLLGRIKPIHDTLGRAYSGPALVPGTTVSGLSTEEILKESFAAAPAPSAPTPVPSIRREAPPAAAPDQPDRGEEPPARAEGAISAESIDALLESGRFLEALAACEGLAADPGRRRLGRLLYQYGMALRGVGRGPDAAVMHMRGAILYPQSPFAPASLIETAIIYRQDFRNPDAARRLLEEARERARTLHKPALVERARSELDKLPARE